MGKGKVEQIEDRQEDRPEDRQEDRQEDRPEDRPEDRQEDRQEDRPEDRQEDRPEDRQEDRPEDRLSNLPDEILTTILSYLNTKEAVRTGILSRKWKSVWEFVPVLELCDDDFKFKAKNWFIWSSEAQKSEARLSDFVDRVLVARKLPRLDKISIKSSAFVDGNIMKSWMRAAVERRVSELHIESITREDDTPSELTNYAMLASNNLVSLRLRAYTILYINPTETSSTFLPNLKYLTLCDVSFRDEFSLPNLLSGCPNLEELFIFRPQWRTMRTTLNITSRSIKRFTLRDHDVEHENEVMIIDAPAAEFIGIVCDTKKTYVVRDLSSLVEAHLTLTHISSTCLYKFLRRISHVKSLFLAPRTTMALLNADSGIMPIFHNLTHLNTCGTVLPALGPPSSYSYKNKYAIYSEIFLRNNLPKLQFYNCREFSRYKVQNGILVTC